MQNSTPGTPEPVVALPSSGDSNYNNNNSSSNGDHVNRSESPWAEHKLLSSPIFNSLAKTGFGSEEDVSTNGVHHLDVPWAPSSPGSRTASPTPTEGGSTAIGGVVVPRTRRKTVTKPTPHTFELADVPLRSVPKEPHDITNHSRKNSTAASSTTAATSSAAFLAFSSVQTTASTEASAPPLPPRLAFSKVQTTASTEPVEIPETRVPAAVPASSPSYLGLSGIRVAASTQPLVLPSSSPQTLPKVSTQDSDLSFDSSFDPSFLGSFFAPTADTHQTSSSGGTSRSKASTRTPLAVAAGAAATTATQFQTSTPTPYHFVPPQNPLSYEEFNSKVVVITHGASQVSSFLVRAFHAAGCRIIFGDPSPERARKLISSLGPLDIVHFNKCDVGDHNDVLNLFRLAMTMYGRVDHAIFGVADDGAQAATIRSAESLWSLDDLNDPRLTAKDRMEEVGADPVVNGLSMGDVVTASTRFARIALPFLQKGCKPDMPYMDKSLTLITSSAAFTTVPNLAVYQISQHVVLGTVRALAQTTYPLRGGGYVRVNGVVTNMMIPTLVPQDSGRRVGVQLPQDQPEDISRVVLGVVGSGSKSALMQASLTDDDQLLHGRILYVVGEEGRVGAYDLQQGLDATEAAWMGPIAKQYFDKAKLGYGNGRDIEWMLNE